MIDVIGFLKNNTGKVTVFTLLTLGVVCLVFFVVLSLNLSDGKLQMVMADDVTTSVTVLNTPPNWTIDAQEQSESSTSTPTNSGSVMTWDATATDDNADDYYLIICKTSGAPTAGSGGPPTCNGGDANEWTVSGVTSSGSEATAATTTAESWSESNDWYAFICDDLTSSPQCHADYKQGTGSTASPFNVNHRPYFFGYWDDSPVDPGAEVIFYATSSDPDIVDVQDTVKLFVCTTGNFTPGVGCDDGTRATSTFVTSDPQASTTISIPAQDNDYGAYFFIVDNHNHMGTTTQGSNSVMTVANVAPDFTGESGNIDLYDSDGDPLNLITPQGTTTWNVSFNVNDNNSCENISAGDEIALATAHVYRSGITQSGCDTAGEYDANNCYPGHHEYTELICSQDTGSCTGSTDTQSSWTCTTTVWYIAQPTDGASVTDSTWWSETWLVSVQVNDDDNASSTLTETTAGGTELTYLVGYDVSTTSIAYGGLEPGQENDPLDRTTDLISIGNVGLDEDLYGDTMCPSWTAPDSCDPVDSTGDIPVGEQHFATSSIVYASGTSLTASSSPTEIEIDIAKTTSTSSPATKDTYWGIHIPIAITLAGDYIGQNTITAIRGEAQQW